MNDTYLTLMAILRSALHAELFAGEISASSTEALFHLADIHSLLPVVVDAVCARKELRGEVLDKYRGKAVQKCTRQLVQYHSFLSLLEAAQARGADPVVVKGILCRALYPKPYLRLSVDDDLFACRNDFLLLDELLREEGLRPDAPDADPSGACFSGNMGSYHARTTERVGFDCRPFGLYSRKMEDYAAYGGKRDK